MRKGSISKSNVWDKLSLDDLARQHFIETLISNDGFSAPIKNGKPIHPKDVQMPPSNGSRAVRQKNSSGVVGTAVDTNLTITDSKRLGKVLATRYGPTVDIACVKSDLESKLKTTTGIDHTVNVERVQTKYSSYSSFKITCMCSDINILYNPSIWPKGSFVKRWIDPRNSRGGIIGTSTQ